MTESQRKDEVDRDEREEREARVVAEHRALQRLYYAHVAETEATELD